MVLLGFFSLAGIVINNGIVLIDRINTEEWAKGLSAFRRPDMRRAWRGSGPS